MKNFYIKDAEHFIGKKVNLYGWVHEIRETGNFIFIVVRDSTGKLQITIRKKDFPEKLVEIAKNLHHEDVIGVNGLLIRSEIAKLGIEIIPDEIYIINSAKHPLLLDVTGKVDAELSTILDGRFLSLRREDYFSIFKIQSELLRQIREYLYQRDFTEIISPKIIKFATEGGAELFKIDYFEEKAYLAQSPQIYKEMCAGVFEKVFEIGQYYRAEKSRTPYHLSEFISFDVECAFYSYQDIMDLLESLLKEVINVTYERASKHFDALKVNRINLDYKFERIKYEEVIGMLEKYGLKWGDDISSQYMKLIEEKIGKKFYFITDWPTILKPFYTYEHENNRNLTKSFDLNYGFLEIASGGERIYKSEQIVEKLKRFGLNVENFETYIKALEAGAPPHAGFGLGLSRLLMILTGKKNIKEVVLFPRDVDRLVP
jgi:aspartyl-tRNA synthetase, archaeal type